MNELPREWLPALIALLKREPAVVRVVVAEVHGSAPRDPGAFMFVGRSIVAGTVGGGRLEWESIFAARDLLTDTTAGARLSRTVLGVDLGQCCGGVVSVWLERFTREDLELLRQAEEAGARGAAVLSSTIKGSRVERRIVQRAGTSEAIDALLRAPRAGARPRVLHDELTFLERLDDEFPAIWLYGAGHVGQALARILSELPLRLTWIDSREELKATAGVRFEPDPVASVSEAPVGAYFLVMTHSHPLDFRLCHEILQRDDFAWLGLIGSESKAARFRSRLRREGFAARAVESLVCPIGIGGIDSKWPAAIAVAVAAQVMQEVSSVTARLGAPEPMAASPGPHVFAAHDCSAEECATCGRQRTTETS